MINIQSKELNSAKDILNDNTKLRKHSIQTLLLTKWREKVFQLLVQLKSTEISHGEDTKKMFNQVCIDPSNTFWLIFPKVQDFKKELEELRRENSIAEQKKIDLAATLKISTTNKLVRFELCAITNSSVCRCYEPEIGRTGKDSQRTDFWDKTTENKRQRSDCKVRLKLVEISNYILCTEFSMNISGKMLW